MSLAYHFPQKTAPAVLGKDERGIASLTHPGVGTFRFRSNPKQFNWGYTLNKRVDQTYGGRVVQLLGTKIEDFSFTADCGTERWAYMNRVALFMRDVMIEQRRGIPATFEYTTRGWKFNAYVVSIPFADAVEEVLREFEVTLKVQEDVSGVMSRNTIMAELRRLQDGLAFTRSKYNDPRFAKGFTGDPEAFIGDMSQQMQRAAGQLAGAAGNFTQNFLPNGLPAATYSPTTTGTGIGSFINSLVNGGAN